MFLTSALCANTPPGHTSSAGSSATVVERASGVVVLVLRRHAEAAWRVTLSALRGGQGHAGSADAGSSSAQVGVLAVRARHRSSSSNY